MKAKKVMDWDNLQDQIRFKEFAKVKHQIQETGNTTAAKLQSFEVWRCWWVVIPLILIIEIPLFFLEKSSHSRTATCSLKLKP